MDVVPDVGGDDISDKHNGINMDMYFKKPVLLLLTGLEGVGKSTYAEHLVKSYHFVELSFAETLREVTADLWNGFADAVLSHSRALSCMSRFNIEDSKTPGKKEEPFTLDEDDYSKPTRGLYFPHSNPVTHRSLLQFIGTDILRKHLGEDIWVNAVMAKIKRIVDANPDGYRIVISDCRFANEECVVKKAYPHAALVKIVGPCTTGEEWSSWWEHEKEILAKTHISNAYTVTCTPDVCFSNVRTRGAFTRSDTVVFSYL